MTPDVIEERYGTGPGRSDGSGWEGEGSAVLGCTLSDDRLLLDLPHGVPDGWLVRRYAVQPTGGLVAEFRVRCDSQLRGPSLVVGVRSDDGTEVLVRQGGMTRPWNDIGPYGDDQAGVTVAAFEPGDWHTWTLHLAEGSGEVRLEIDDRAVLGFRLPAPTGSLATGVLMIGSERPGQRIELARTWVGGHRRPIATTGLSASLDADWALDGAERVPMRMRREPRNPVVAAGRPGWPGGSAAYDAWVARDGDAYRMWYVARSGGAGATVGIHHARSADGVAWEPDGSAPPFEGGRWGAWDEGGVQGPVVVRTEGGWRMWYAGYLPGHREGRVCVADSPDGRAWEPVRVGRFSFRGSLENNIAYDLGTGPDDRQYVMPQCVVVDPDAPAERRYTLFVHAQGRAPIIGVARSPDGLSFTRDAAAERHHAVAVDRPDTGRLHQRTAVVREGDLWTAFFGYIAPEPRVTLHTYATTWRIEAGEEPPSLGLWQATRQLVPRPGTWEAGFTWPTSMVPDADGWRLYYTGSVEAFDGAVGLATLRPGALHGIRAVRGHRAALVSRPLQAPRSGWAGYRLAIDSRGPGSLRAALGSGGVASPIAGRATTDALPTRPGRTIAAWVGGDDLPDTGTQPLIISILLEGRRTLHSVHLIPPGVDL
jgi:hypothetical protein